MNKEKYVQITWNEITLMHVSFLLVVPYLPSAKKQGFIGFQSWLFFILGPFTPPFCLIFGMSPEFPSLYVIGNLQASSSTLLLCNMIVLLSVLRENCILGSQPSPCDIVDLELNSSCLWKLGFVDLFILFRWQWRFTNRLIQVMGVTLHACCAPIKKRPWIWISWKLKWNCMNRWTSLPS